MNTPKPIKVFYHGTRLKDIYPHATGWQVFKYRFAKFMRKLTIVAMICAAVAGAYKVGNINSKEVTVYANKEIIKEVEAEAPILDRIAQCESGGTHYGKSGQVIFNANTNGTVDIGKFQINSLWGKKATELGLDLTKEKDNEAFAKWLYANRGTEDWYSSKHCWQK